MTTAEEIEDNIADLIAQLITLHGVDRAEGFIRTVYLQFAAARNEVCVVRMPPRLRVISGEDSHGG